MDCNYMLQQHEQLSHLASESEKLGINEYTVNDSITESLKQA